jgi:hypothetical protein
MRRILVVLVTAAAAGVVALGGVALVDPEKAEAARFRSFTKSALTNQSGDFNVQADVANINDPVSPYSYTRVRKVVRITQVTITARITDGGTGPGELDENHLTLALDGIDTDIKLNGFRTNQTDTLTISGTPIHRDAITAALKADRKLNASIIDDDPNDNTLSVPETFITELTIQGKRRR